VRAILCERVSDGPLSFGGPPPFSDLFSVVPGPTPPHPSSTTTTTPTPTPRGTAPLRGATSENVHLTLCTPLDNWPPTRGGTNFDRVEPHAIKHTFSRIARAHHPSLPSRTHTARATAPSTAPRAAVAAAALALFFCCGSAQNVDVSMSSTGISSARIADRAKAAIYGMTIGAQPGARPAYTRAGPFRRTRGRHRNAHP
jgi:hypothetical protein